MSNIHSKERTAGELLKLLATGEFTTLKKIEQGGALQARRLSAGGIKFYWRYTHEGKTDRVAIGTYDSAASPKSLAPTTKGYSVAAAAEVCRIKATIQTKQAAFGGYREHVAGEKRVRELAETEKLREQQQLLSLSQLLDTYTAHLEKQGRSSCADARSIFRLHVVEAWPVEASSPASSITAAQVTDMRRKLLAEGRGRTSNKLRAYMRAAYQCALDVDSLAMIPVTFKAFSISTNPAALTKRDAVHDKADKRPLLLADLRKYWQLIKTEPGIKGAALRLHLLSGGQRVEQLTKLRNTDVSADGFTILDAKGRPGQGPRKHTVPLLPAAKAAIAALSNDGEYVLSTNGGKTPLSAMTLSNWAKGMAESIADFQLKRIRSGVETALAAAGVSKEVRGHLQSHGLSGVQTKHYDDYSYSREKREALQILFDLLESNEMRHEASVLPRHLDTGRSL